MRELMEEQKSNVKSIQVNKSCYSNSDKVADSKCQFDSINLDKNVQISKSTALNNTPKKNEEV